MFGINDRDVKRMEADLKNFASQALPYATRNTLNQAAFTTMREAKEGIRDNMTTRNKWTERSVRVEKSRSLTIPRQSAAVGSGLDYMETQEFGGVERKTGSEGVAIPTSYSAGLAQNAKPRTRLPRKPNRIQNIQLRKRRGSGGSRKQQNLEAIKGAATSGRKFVFLDLGRRKGIFKVTGGKRRPKIRMVYDLTRPSVVIPKNPWLRPAVQRVEPQVARIHAASLRFQLKRLGLFKS